MKTIGIIAEYNPFHLGHLYQINEIKKKYPDSIIIIITPSCFTQRGEVSIINKWNKTKICLENNIDIVIELPFVYAVQSSDIFAKGAITILNKLKIDTLVFGTETDNIESLKKMAEIQLYNKNYNILVKKYLDKGINYPTSLSKALKDILGITVNTPNDLLALSYIKEIMKINKNIEIINIKRTNDYHSKTINSNIVNASLIREYILNNKNVNDYLPKYNNNYIYKDLSINNFFPLLKYQIINNIDCLNKFLTVDEGIENRIKKYIYTSDNWQELVNNIKTKRYTYNKINRMLVHIMCNLTKETVSKLEIDYIRILGFNNQGRKHLNNIKKEINTKLITNYKENISPLFDIEYKINCIYAIVTEDKLIKEEINHNPIIYD